MVKPWYRVGLALSLLLVTPQTSRGAGWWLWESPTDDEAFVDLSQTESNNFNFVMNGSGVGQSFVPTHDFLYRIDFMLANGQDRRPFTLRLWKWIDQDGSTPGCAENVEHDATVAQAPLWQETLSLPGPNASVLRSFFPRVHVQPGALYYVEFGFDSPDGEWLVHSQWGPDDPYSAGVMWVNGHFQSPDPCVPGPTPALTGDLYFKTYYAAGPAPAAPTCADGSPAPCFSPADAWSVPSPAGPPITAQDYRSIVANHAAGRDAYLVTPNPSAADWALFDAFLYESAGSAENAEYARALLRRAYEWRSAHLDESVSFTWGEHPGWAYYWLRDYGGLTPEDHALIGSLLLHSGRGLWPYRELGAFDHALGAAVTYTLLTSLLSPEEFQTFSTCAAPLPAGYACLFGPSDALDATDHAEWKAYADQAWAEFTAHFDFLDDCANYQYGLDFRYVLELDWLRAEFRGEPSIWEAPGFRKLVERYAQMITPLGPSPVYGDTYGWNQSWGNPALLFETAASRLNDTRYRWLAYRLMDYQRNHIRDTTWDGQPIAPWEAVYYEYPAFALAYFAVNESLATLIPPPQSEQVAAQQGLVGSSWIARSRAIGQTFKPTASPLVRLEFSIDNLGGSAPLTLRLWKWNPRGHAATVAEAPLYEDALDVEGPVGFQLRSLTPFLDVEVGQSYFVELSRGTRPRRRAKSALFDSSPAFETSHRQGFRIQGSGSNAGSYREGDLYFMGKAISGRDLWFKTYTLTADGSVATWRRDVNTLLLGDLTYPLQYQVFGDKDVPDKLILKSGHAPGDLHAVFNLIADFCGNAHAETGSLVSLTAGGAPLITGSSYYDRQDKDEASAIVRRFWGGTRRVAADASDVLVRDARLSTWASIRWDDPRGWDIDQERRIFFVKNRLLWVRDRASFGSPITASAGNVWHARDIRPPQASDWYDVYNRVPRGLNGFQYKAPEQYLLIRFLDRGYANSEWEVASESNPPSPPFVLAQRWNDEAAAGDSLWFDTVLLPHGPEVAPAQAAAGIKTLYDDGVNAAVQVVTQGETWTLVDNPGKVLISAGGLFTDATYLIARTTGDAPYLLTREASRVHLEDPSGAVFDWSWPVSTSVEVVGGAAAAPAARRAPPRF